MEGRTHLEPPCPPFINVDHPSGSLLRKNLRLFRTDVDHLNRHIANIELWGRGGRRWLDITRSAFISHAPVADVTVFLVKFEDGHARL